MSSPELKKIAAEITTELAKLGGDAGREDLVRQHGQLLVINKRRFNNILRSIFPKLIGSNSNAKKALKEIWKNWDIYLKSHKAKITDVKDGAEILYTAAERIKQLAYTLEKDKIRKILVERDKETRRIGIPFGAENALKQWQQTPEDFKILTSLGREISKKINHGI